MLSIPRYIPIGAFLAFLCGHALAGLPDPQIDTPAARTSAQEEAVFAGGCFWGVEAVFRHVRGVGEATSGYAGGSAATARYEIVSSGETSHAESVRIRYDPAQISYGQLLKVFFAVAHDPTQLNRQGPDIGPQYRSEIFAANPEQQRIADAYIAQLDAARAFPRKIVTRVTRQAAFYPAEDYHQDYAARHPYHPYIVINDAPKVQQLKKDFPQLYR